MSQQFLLSLTSLATLSLDTNDLIISQGNQQVTGSLDQSALGTGIANVYWDEYATPTILGTAGEPLIAKVTGVFLCKGPGGRCFWQPTATSAKLQNIGATRFTLGTGTLTNCENSGQGDITLQAGCVNTNFRLGGGSMYAANNATAFTTYVLSGGSGVVERSITTLTQSGGSLVFGRSDGSLTGITMTTANINSGSFVGRGAVGAITTLTGTGDAFIDMRGCTQALTVTNLNVSADVRNRSYFRSSKATITYTNTTVYGSENQTIYQ